MEKPMKKLIWITVAMLALLAGTARADRYDADLNIDKKNKPVASDGHVSFELQANGTVKATLSTVAGGGQPFQFGFNSVDYLLSKDFVVASGDIKDIKPLGAQPGDIFSLGTLLGNFESGFVCYSCTTEISWTIVGKNNQAFTSVKQVLGGGADVDFALYSYMGPGIKSSFFGGKGVYTATSAVPEAQTWLMLLAGLGLIAWMGWRRPVRRQLVTELVGIN
jgi:hypothetical protein